MVFSIGNNYQIVPLNQIISLDTLLAPLQSNHQATIGDVIKLVIQEDNHPPLYFILAISGINYSLIGENMYL